MRFTLPQFGIFAQGTHAHRFLELDLRPDVAAADAVGAFRGLRMPGVSAGGVNLLIAFGSAVWRAVASAAAPVDLAPFVAVTGRDGHHVPATQHDAWLWISGAEPLLRAVPERAQRGGAGIRRVNDRRRRRVLAGPTVRRRLTVT
jgi:hypothetical protein